MSLYLLAMYPLAMVLNANLHAGKVTAGNVPTGNGFNANVPAGKVTAGNVPAGNGFKCKCTRWQSTRW